MKHQITTLFLALGLCEAALAGSPPLPAYANYGVVTQAPVIDSPSFFNAGVFEIDAVTSINLTNLNNIFGNGYSVLPFMTKDTLYFTNTGLMTGFPGFRFDTGTSTSRHSASLFLNEGTLMGLDTEAFLYLYSTPGSKTEVPIPADSQPIPSELFILATNIINTGDVSVGNAGLMRMLGQNVTNSFSSLTAGAVSTVGILAETNDVTGLQGEEDVASDGSGHYFFLPSLGVYDLYWGVTNGDTVNVGDLAGDLPFGLPEVISGERGFDVPIFFGGNANAQYSVTAFSNAIGTNIYYDIVFINTNFASPNMSAALGVSTGGDFLQFEPVSSIPAPNFGAFENIVQISEPVVDVITGQTVTNGIYIIDDGGILPSMTLALNGSEPGSSEPEGFSRPNPFEVTTVTPFQWSEAFQEAQEFPSTPFYDPNDIYNATDFNNNMQALETSAYGAQIGRNPSDLYGSFAPLIDATSDTFLGLELLDQVNLPDPTNEPGRIEITGNNVDLTQTRLRAEGMFILNATNLAGVGTTTQDWGQANVSMGAANGALTVSNIFPTTFQRVRGDIYLQSATWQNTQTNQFGVGNTNAATNQWYYHVFVVDQNLFGTFPSTVRSLRLTGSNTIVLQDNLNVINQAVINTPNLTITSTNFFSQNAQNFLPANAPGLKNLFIGPEGVLGTSSILDIGLNESQGQGSPTGRKYAVNSIVNFGQMIATAPLLQSAYIENAGQIASENGGSMVIAASVLSLGPALSNLTTYVDSQTNALGLTVTNSTNYLFADGSINLSAATLEASNSIIEAGLGGTGGLTLDVTGQLTDFVSSTPTTNTNSVLVNFWNTTGGFSMPVKPATGDLFGTEIHTVASGNQQAIHVWAGTDAGATTAGFVNNAVIGRLVLDRSTNAVLRFSAAGAKNAMYVDYLELTNFAFSDYRTGLVIDPNFKIYFADCNADPQKLMEVYPGLVWVQSFVGPNSTQVVPYVDSSNICLMNAALAQSTEISFFNGVANFYNQPYVLNNPSDPSQIYPCPGDETTVQSDLVTSPAPGGGSMLNLLNITINGQGKISPGLKATQLALGKSYTLTATPAKGWVFQSWSTIGLAGSVNVNSPVLPFTFLSNTVITANFMPNPFTLVQGSYNGLFYENNAVNPGSAGAFSLTLANSGTFSGRLLMGASVYTFNSQFSGSGGAQTLAKSGAHGLAVNLQLDMTGQSGQIIGDVNGGAWDAALTANVAPTWTAQNPSPLAGSYTFVLPWQSGIVGAPGGDSYAVGTINKQGVLSMAGALADGATFSASAPVSQGGLWPFYVYAASGKDTVLGWVSVGNGLSGTNISWSKLAGKAALYQAGFNNTLAVEGSRWLAPAAKSSALTLTDPSVVLSGGNLPEPLVGSVTLQNFLTYSGTGLSLSIRPSNGSFSGWFTSPGASSKQTISGVVLQNQGLARGFFSGTNTSGSVLLEGQ